MNCAMPWARAELTALGLKFDSAYSCAASKAAPTPSAGPRARSSGARRHEIRHPALVLAGPEADRPATGIAAEAEVPALPPFIAIHKGSGRGRTGVPPQGEVAVHERGDCGKLAAAVSTTTPTSRFQSDWALNSREVPQGAVPGDGALDLDARLSERDPVAEAGRQGG